MPGVRPSSRVVAAPSVTDPDALQIEIRNLRSGQVIEMTVTGPWTEPDLVARLTSLIEVRQPTEIQLHLPSGATAADPPSFDAVRELLADIGGTLVVTATDPDTN